MSWTSLWAEVVPGRQNRQSSIWCLSVHVRKRSGLVEKRCPRCSWARPRVGAARTAPVRAPLAGRSERCLVSHGAYCARMHVERAPTGAKLDTCRALPKPPSERGHLLCFRDWSKQATRVKSWNHAQQTLQGTSLVRSRRHGRLRNTARPMMSLMANGGRDVTPVVRSLTRSIRAASPESLGKFARGSRG